MAQGMQLRVVSPASVVYEGEAGSIIAPAWDGEVGVLPGHAPMLTLLGSGDLSVDPDSAEKRVFKVEGGVMKVENNVVTVLAERVE